MILSKNMYRLCKFAFKLQSSMLQTNRIITSTNQIRCLFSRQELGIDKYQEVREDTQNKWVRDAATYKQNFKIEMLDERCNFTKFEYGLKNFLHLMNKSEYDVSILRDALNTLIKRQEEHKWNKYNFGTIIMRSFYYLDMPNEAVKFFENKDLGQIFTQVTCHQIILDLLYEHNRYGDVLSVYNLITGGKLTKNKTIDIFMFATYYRLNTPEALEKAYDLFNQMTEFRKKQQFRKSRTFIAGLALKQNKPEIALEVLKDEEKYFYVTVRHIRLLALAHMGKFDEVFGMLRAILRRHNAKNEHKTSIQVLNDIEHLLHEKSSEIYVRDFCLIRKEIESLGLITKETLDDMLCTPFPEKSASNSSHLSKK